MRVTHNTTGPALKRPTDLLLLYEQLKETDNAGSSSTIVQAETDKQSTQLRFLFPKDESEETKKADTSTQTRIRREKIMLKQKTT